MLFEAKGYSNFREFPGRTERINKRRLSALRELYQKGEVNGKLSRLVANDGLFEEEPELAYALSWALAFYLAENRPEKFWGYVQNDAARKPFSVVPPADRMSHFADAFGFDLLKLEFEMRAYFYPPEDEKRDRERNKRRRRR